MKDAADLNTYDFKWISEERDERIAFGAVKSWAKANNMQVEKGA